MRRKLYIIALLPLAACLQQFPAFDNLSVLALSSLADGGASASSTSTSGFSVGGTVTGLTGSLVLTNNSTDTLNIAADGSFVFPANYQDGSAYSVAVSSVSGTQQCTATNSAGTIAGSNVSSITITCFSEFNPAGAPNVIVNIPNSGATGITTCAGSFCRARLFLQFDQSMDSTQTPIVSAMINGNATNVNIIGHTWFHTSFVDDSVIMNLSWVHFPEFTTITPTFSQTPLRDKGGTTITADYSFSFTTGAGFHYQLADSGQTQCSNGSAFGACPQGVFGQDGDYVDIPAARSFTGPDNAAFAADYITTDNVTGLTWTTCPAGFTYTGSTCGGGAISQTWYNAVNACSALNGANAGAGYAGQIGWRLPTIRELKTIVNFGNQSPATDTAHFDSIPATGFFWSATTSASAAGNSHRLDIATGLDSRAGKSNSNMFRCVRGTGTTASFTDNGDETVTDNITNLLWTKCLRGTSGTNCLTGTTNSANLTPAITDCENLTLAGRSDWRLPGVHEYGTILDFTAGSPSHDTTFFPGSGTIVKTATTSPANATSPLHADTSNSGTTVPIMLTLPYRCVAN